MSEEKDIVSFEDARKDSFRYLNDFPKMLLTHPITGKDLVIIRVDADDKSGTLSIICVDSFDKDTKPIIHTIYTGEMVSPEEYEQQEKEKSNIVMPSQGLVNATGQPYKLEEI